MEIQPQKALLKTHYSNKAEILYDYFKENLFKGTAPLAKRIVVVPSRAMKSWLTLKLAEDKDVGIAAGIEIQLLEPAIKKIANLTVKKKTLINEPTAIELTLALELSIKNICTAKNPNQNYLPLLNYIGVNTSKLRSNILTKNAKSKIIGLATVLSKTFLEYGVYGKKLIDSWKNREDLNWQELLWFEMEKMFFPWNYPAKNLSNSEFNESLDAEMIQIHLFGLSYLPPLYVEFLANISKVLPVNFYQLSPCQKFWGDMLTDKESLKLLNLLKKKGVKASVRESLEDYILDSSPLLANFGKLGREMANIVDEFPYQIKVENYALPESVCHYPEYTDWLTDELAFEKTTKVLTLLEAVQADMALMKSPSEESRILFESYDSSIQVHAAPKPRREVEVIYDAILEILNKHQKSSNEIINPSDILVMAPEIDRYLPFIRTIFQKGVCPLDVQLVEPSSLMEYEVVRGFIHLLKMAKSRMTAPAILELFSFSSFRNKQNIDSDALKVIEKWVKEVNVYWGKDKEHRKQLFTEDYPFIDMDVNSTQGTWESGFQQMIEGLIFNSEELSDDDHDIHPLNGIEFSEEKHLLKLLNIMNSLEKDFKPLLDGSLLNLNAWIDYLKCILEVYFFEGGDANEKEEYQKLAFSLTSLKSEHKNLNKGEFSFEVIFNVLENYLQKETASYKGSNLNAIKFSSLLPMRTVPAKVIVLMGLGVGLFPREANVKTWNLMFGNPLSDYCPDNVDFDRFLILEAILSARNYLIFSYTSQEPGNIKEIEPSQVVKELLHYLDQSYQVAGDKPSKFCKVTHPLDSFDAKIFSGEFPFKSYSIDYFKAAKAEQNAKKKPPFTFIKSFCPLPHSIQEQLLVKQNEISLDLKTLLQFAKNPLKSFLNVQGMFVRKDNESQDDSELFLSNLNSYVLVKEAIKNETRNPFELLIKKACKKGLLAQGSFLNVGVDRLKNEILLIEEHVESLGIKKNEIFSLRFNEKHEQKDDQIDCTMPLYVESSLYGRIKITGSFDFVTPQGAIFFAKDDLKKAIELFPAILVFACLIKDYKLKIKNNAIFIKQNDCKIKPIEFENPKELLTRFVEYYITSKNSPSPLSPEYVQRLLRDNSKMLEQYSLSASDEKNFMTYQDPHTRWLDINSKDAEIASNINYWKDVASSLYASLETTWYESRQKTRQLHEDV